MRATIIRTESENESPQGHSARNLTEVLTPPQIKLESMTPNNQECFLFHFTIFKKIDGRASSGKVFVVKVNTQRGITLCKKHNTWSPKLWAKQGMNPSPLLLHQDGFIFSGSKNCPSNHLDCRWLVYLLVGLSMSLEAASIILGVLSITSRFKKH